MARERELGPLQRLGAAIEISKSMHFTRIHHLDATPTPSSSPASMLHPPLGELTRTSGRQEASWGASVTH